MDFRPGVLKRLELKDLCHDLVTRDRQTFWEATKARLEQRKIDLSGLLRLCTKRDKD